MRPITEILIEFPRAVPAGLLALADEPPPEPVFDDGAERSQALAEARQEGMVDARAAAEVSCAVQLAALADDHAAALREARAAWAAAEGAVLSACLRTGLAAIEAGIAGRLADVLAPFVEASARSRAAAAMRQAIADLLGGGHGGLIEVRGPADLVAPVRAAFADREVVVVTEADEPEVSARAGDTIIASQVEAWTSHLRAALGSEVG